MNERVLVIQLGLTGMSFVRYFSALGCDVDIVDERDDPPGVAALEREFPTLRYRKVANYRDLDTQVCDYDDILVSPGIPPHRLPPSLRAVGDLSCFVRAYRDRWPDDKTRPCLIAITGTNGKSTVTNLVAGMLTAGGNKAVAVGNIGVPLLDALQDWERQSWPQFIVAELSSFQLANLDDSLAADVACVLNITPDHLGWHGSEDAYAAAKLRVYASAGVSVCNRANPISVAEACSNTAQLVGFGDRNSAVTGEWTISDSKVIKEGTSGLEISTTALTAAGIMPESACAALAIAGSAAPWQDEAGHVRWLAQADGLPHRFEKVGTWCEIQYINDSKATNVAATKQALTVVVEPCVLIAGGEPKDQNFADLAQRARDHVVTTVLIGSEPECLAPAFGAVNIPVRKAPNMATAVHQATLAARRRHAKVVLLSPACSSLDQYQDFAARGEAFRQAVRQLEGSGNALA